MSNKRSSDDISGETETQKSPQLETSAPKRSKLDFLAMIAEMSEKNDEEARNSPVNTENPEPSVAEPAITVAAGQGPWKLTSSGEPKSESSKSSFAAWKLAKGKDRKTTAKIPSRKEVAMDRAELPQGTQAVVSEEETSVSSKESPQASTNQVDLSPISDALAAAAPLPLNKGGSGVKTAKAKDAKMSSGPKKAGASNKKDKDATATKRTPKRKGEKAAKGKAKKSDQSNSKTSTFPEKIMELLQNGLASDAIYWLPEGEAIAVDPESFKDNAVISKQFRGNKLSSFVRSLNRWGFRRIFYHSLPDKTLAFYHRLFQKQSPQLVKEMQMDGGDKESEPPEGAMAAAAAVALDDAKLSVLEGKAQKPGSFSATQPRVAVAAAAQTSLGVLSKKAPGSPAKPATAPSAPDAIQAAFEAASKPAAAPASPHERGLGSAAPATSSTAQSLFERGALDRSALERSGLDRSTLEQYLEAQQALQLQQALSAEQERSDMALQSLHAQQLILQSLSEQQNVAHAEELLMQSMLADHQRSEIALQQRQAEQALLQHMLAEQESMALAEALRGGAGGLSTEALLRERLLAQHYGGAANPDQAGSSDVLALLQQQLQGGNQQAQQERELSYMEQLLLLEQQQQRQHEAAILAAHGYHFG